MTEFKLWYDNDGITFHNQTNIYFSQCNKNKKLSLSELLRITSDVAVEDYRQQGMSREFLLEHNFAILVSRVSFHIERMPLENEHITVTTWEEKPEPLQLKRAYEISAGESTIIKGLSTWLVVNPTERRIIPTKNFTLNKNIKTEKMSVPIEPGKIILPQNMKVLDERTIRYSDLDGNGHTNNSHYGAFIIDALPSEYVEKDFCDFRINYSKEALLGQKLSIEADIDDAAKKITVAGKGPEGNSFESELYWR